MFGLNDMYQEREKLYMRCKRQQAKAGADRTLAKKQTLEAISSTKGLLVSFALGYRHNVKPPINLVERY